LKGFADYCEAFLLNKSFGISAGMKYRIYYDLLAFNSKNY